MTVTYDGGQALATVIARTQIDEWCEQFANPDEERQFVDELYRCGWMLYRSRGCCVHFQEVSGGE